MAHSSWKTYSLLTATAILWGGNPVSVKYVLGELSPVTTVFLRFTAISIILLAIVFYNEGRKALPSKRHIVTIVLMGFTGIVLNNGLQFTGLKFSSAVNCTLISATNPAMTALLAAPMLNEKVQARQWFGIMVSFAGVIFLVTHGSWEVIKSFSFNAGDILFLGGQLGWALYSILGRKIVKELSPMATTAWTGLAGAAFMAAGAFNEGFTGTFHLSTYGWIAMLYMIVGSGILAFNWWNEGLSVVGPSRVAIFSNIIPLAGMALSAILLGEHVGWQELAGAAGIILGVAITTHQPALIPNELT
jgi:drug/metabolite transporter (DMT)-like permease